MQTPAPWTSTLALTLRLALAAVVLAALTSDAVRAARDGLLAQDVSSFTNQSNAMLVVLAVATAWIAVLPRRIDDLRGAVAFYLVITGLMYALLVAPLSELGRWDIGWQGIVLHRLAPLAALADWLLTPRRGPARRTRILWWLAYPLAYLALTWIRGAITGWYPYAFLDPTVAGWGPVLVAVLVALAAFVAVATLLHLAGGRLARGGPVPARRSPARARPARRASGHPAGVPAPGAEGTGSGEGRADQP